MEEKNNLKRSKRKKKKSILPRIFVLIIIIAIIVCSVIFIPKFIENNKQTKIEDKLIGSWTTDGYTVYEFYKDEKGALVIPMATYNFSYRIEENKISIDFEDEKSIDSDYEFSFKDDNLILKGINKTTGTYTFRKNEK